MAELHPGNTREFLNSMRADWKGKTKCHTEIPTPVRATVLMWGEFVGKIVSNREKIVQKRGGGKLGEVQVFASYGLGVSI